MIWISGVSCCLFVCCCCGSVLVGQLTLSTASVTHLDTRPRADRAWSETPVCLTEMIVYRFPPPPFKRSGVCVCVYISLSVCVCVCLNVCNRFWHVWLPKQRTESRQLRLQLMNECTGRPMAALASGRPGSNRNTEYGGRIQLRGWGSRKMGEREPRLWPSSPNHSCSGCVGAAQL